MPAGGRQARLFCFDVERPTQVELSKVQIAALGRFPSGFVERCDLKWFSLTISLSIVESAHVMWETSFLGQTEQLFHDNFEISAHINHPSFICR